MFRAVAFTLLVAYVSADNCTAAGCTACQATDGCSWYNSKGNAARPKCAATDSTNVIDTTVFEKVDTCEACAYSTCSGCFADEECDWHSGAYVPVADSCQKKGTSPATGFEIVTMCQSECEDAMTCAKCKTVEGCSWYTGPLTNKCLVDGTAGLDMTKRTGDCEECDVSGCYACYNGLGDDSGCKYWGTGTEFTGYVATTCAKEKPMGRSEVKSDSDSCKDPNPDTDAAALCQAPLGLLVVLAAALLAH